MMKRLCRVDTSNNQEQQWPTEEVIFRMFVTSGGHGEDLPFVPKPGIPDRLHGDVTDFIKTLYYPNR